MRQLLTLTEKRVVELLRRGLSNKLIAHEMGLADTTVKVHMRHIMAKTKATNRVQVVLMDIDAENVWAS